MVSDVAISPDDSECVVLAKAMDLRIVISSDCFGPGIGLILAKVMEVAKEIRPGDKKRVKTGVKTPIKRRSGWGPGGCWRMVWAVLVAAGGCLPFWVPEMQGGRARRRGWRCYRWRLGRRGDGLLGMAGRW